MREIVLSVTPKFVIVKCRARTNQTLRQNIEHFFAKNCGKKSQKKANLQPITPLAPQPKRTKITFCTQTDARLSDAE